MKKVKLNKTQNNTNTQEVTNMKPKKKKHILRNILSLAIFIWVMTLIFGGNGNSEPKTSHAATHQEQSVPREYKNALKKAKTYSDMMHMSKAGLYYQLTSPVEGYSAEAAQYAVDNLEVNYFENAVKNGENYLNIMSMSPQGLFDQLTSEYGEKFTPEEAQYAVDTLFN